MSDYKRISVKWADHFFLEGPLDQEEIIENLKPYVRTTIGYIIAESKRVLAIASTYDPDGTFTEVNYLMKRCIISREYL